MAQSVGVSYPAISPSDLARLPVPTLDLPAQRAIADFLDAETARIDALIAKKQQLVERLNQRLSVEHERLVLGQNRVQGSSTNGKFYGATVWPETALRHLNCEVQTGPFGSQLHAEDYVKDGWPVVNPSNIIGGRIIALPEITVDYETRTRLVRHTLKPGDIVFGRRGEMGRAGLVHEHEAGWLCGTGSLRLRLVGNRLLPDYLKLLLETGAAKRYFQLSSVGSTMENLNTEILLALPVLVPSIGEQSWVVSVVSRARAHNLDIEGKLNRSIALLIEHRQALITAAVTGEIEVPGTTTPSL
ncbi:MAG: restriction endonuclease subunit S [Rubrobacteraceae bacterium]